VDAALSEILKPAAWESLALFIIGSAMILLSVYLTSVEKKRAAASGADTRIF
jgi:hypothetical protein